MTLQDLKDAVAALVAAAEAEEAQQTTYENAQVAANSAVAASDLEKSKWDLAQDEVRAAVEKVKEIAESLN